jgi:hypothetical protein
VNPGFEEPDSLRARKEVRRRGALEVATPILEERVTHPIVARPFACVRPALHVVLASVCDVLGVTLATMQRPYARDASRAKRIAVHAGNELGITTSDVAAAFGLTRQRGSRIALRALSPDELADCRAVCVRVSALTRKG